MTIVTLPAPRIGCIALALCVLSVNGWAADAMEKKAATPPPAQAAPAAPREPVRLDTTTIKGQQGLPKVLNIVPWKRPDGGDLPGRPAVSLVDDALAPLDRGEMRRQLRYENDLAEAANAEAAPRDTTDSK